MKSLVFALALATAVPFAFAGSDLVFESGFEAPAVTHRTQKDQGADVAKGDKPLWKVFRDSPESQASSPTGTAKGGSILGGLTNEIAHSGGQSLFIQADNVTAPFAGVTLISNPIKITPGRTYSVGIWGRNDVRTPVTAESQRFFLKLKVDFFAEDGSSTGEPQFLIAPLPGTLGHPPLFVQTQWRQLAKPVTAPSDAQTMTVTWKWEASPGKRTVNGVMYFDDATVSVAPDPQPEDAASPAAPGSQDAK